ncbi:MAG: tRNA nucleotidyltransferase (EC (EC [uncultured Sulfurovum sp.]|uniref:tRNA nucleotidyltransferase ) n=1 Tax=uncultured Sulfurovum sp. TaxID=269237 RepID=A0A6S6TTV3_9BACT|nr:MAG: tRNA nucleotidyltransferase (EC (EC [uncultured Sulfurovum sp.]
MKLPEILKTISKKLHKKNAKAIIVGGAVRDHFLQLPFKDIDIEVYGLEHMEALESLLKEYGSVNLVGKSFGVLKLSYEGEEYDFSFPRMESKVGEGHRGFEVEVNGSLDFKTAAKRRDFTLNALGYDVEEKKFLDPFSGLKDIEQKQLRHIDDETFIEDPLRVYRAVQFCARFGFDLAKETFVLCKHMVKKGMLEELAKERVYIEWKKLLLKSEKPSLGFELMKELGIMERYFPELHALIGIKQSPKWHPEGDVWIHTMMTLDEMVQICRSNLFSQDNKYKLRMMFAILCHDLGKATHTTIDNDGRIRAIGHEEAGLVPTKNLIYRLSDEHDFIESLLPLVEHHLKPSQFYAAKSKASAIRRLATKVNIEELIVVAKADFLGRTTKESLAGIYHAGEWLLEKSKALKVINKPLAHLLQGRDLIDLGFKPSILFKEILDAVYTLQIDGVILTKEEAIDFVEKKYK